MERSEKVLDGIRVLCVDDSQDALDLLSIVLARWGAIVTTCLSAEEAIVLLTKERFDVVVSDLSMPPGLGGYDLAHALRDMERRDPDRHVTPTVAVSRDALQATGKRRFADFQVYMPKPFDNARIVHIVDRLMEADGEAVKLGSLGIWEAKQAADAAATATKVAATATAAAVEATSAASDATSAAVKATTAAVLGSSEAASAEKNAAAASSKAPKEPRKRYLH